MDTSHVNAFSLLAAFPNSFSLWIASQDHQPLDDFSINSAEESMKSGAVEDMSSGEGDMIYDVGRCHKSVLLGRYIDRRMDEEEGKLDRG